MATTTNGMDVDDLGGAANGPALALNLGNQVDAFYGASVANFAGLPASGDFAGQRVWLIDVKQHAIWDGTGWELSLGDWVACTAISPFTSNAFVRKEGTRVTMAGYVARSSGSATTLTNAAQIPAGYWPAATPGDHYFGAGQPSALAGMGVRAVVQASNGILQIGMESASSGGIGVATVWYTD